MSTGRRKSPRRLSRAGRLIRTVVLVLFATGVGYAVTLGPLHAARAKAEISDGVQAVEIADGVTITPAQHWLAEPLVHDLLRIPVLPDLRSPRVYLGGHAGLLLRSPDRVLAVEIESSGPGAEPEAEALLRQKASAIIGAGAELPAVRTETLASGHTVWHLDDVFAVLAVVDRGGTLVTVTAEPPDGESIEAYRPAIGQLLETVH